MSPMLTSNFPGGPGFGGATIAPARDNDRLARQLAAVRIVVSDGEWHTLAEIAERVGAPEASVSARLRDLRKPRFGGYLIDREYVHRGLHRYRMVRL